MSLKKNNRFFIILIMIICVILIVGILYTSKQNREKSENFSEPASIEVQSLIEVQNENGPSSILEVNCSDEPTTDAKKHCLDSQEILKQIYNK